MKWGKIAMKIPLAFELDGTLPRRLCVRCTSPADHVTRTYSIVADHGWAERILCSDSYLRDANDIAKVIGSWLQIPVELAMEVTV